MRIDRRLYLVVPVYEGDEGTNVVAHVHSAPLAEDVVDEHFMILGKTYAAIFSGGFGMAAGPAYAMRILRHVAEEAGVWEDDRESGRTGVRQGLVEEMRRLTNVAVKRGDDWEPMPLAIAVDAGVIDEEDLREVENAIAFFIVASASLGRSQRPAMLNAAAELWGARISSSNFTEFLNSLKTSTGTGSSGKRPPADAKGAAAPATATGGGKRRSVPV